MNTKAGTPLYMAPEVLRKDQYNRSVDIFSFGLIVWEIWYGQFIVKVYNVSTLCDYLFNYYCILTRPVRVSAH